MPDSNNREIWRHRFAAALAERGGTDQARQEMIAETPDWLRAILGIPPPWGEKPVDCTCAKWYTDGTHHPECRHIL